MEGIKRKIKILKTMKDFKDVGFKVDFERQRFYRENQTMWTGLAPELNEFPDEDLTMIARGYIPFFYVRKHNGYKIPCRYWIVLLGEKKEE